MQSIHFPEIAKKIENFFSKNRKNSENFFLEIEKNSIFFFSATEKFRKLLWIKIKIENELLCHYLFHPNNKF
jgi:hypothetical protein